MSSLPPVERAIVKQFPKEGKDGMLPVDYISERAIQKSLNRIIGSSLTPEEYNKCIGLIVPLINIVFGEKYGDLRTKENPDSKPLSEVFRNVFAKVFDKDRAENPDKYDLDTLSLINDWANKFSESLYSSAIPKDFYRGSKPKEFERPICIIGAGPAGLYTAMILDSFKIKYEILEASDRVGGRIFTKKLEGGATAGAHDYYDVGAMRFPKISIMSRTFDLFARLDQSNPSDKPEKPKEPDWLRKYHLNGGNNPHFFNSRHSADKDVQSGGHDFFGMGVSNGGVVPDGHAKTGSKALLDAAFKEFKDAFRISNEEGRKKLKDFDMYSTRAYLALVKGYPAEVIEWCENINSTAGLFDQAFTESVIRSTEFDDTDTQWYCIEGGSRVFIEKMVEKIRHKPNTLKRVTSIAVAKESGADIMKVEVQGEKGPRLYSHVVSTVPLSCLRCINLNNAMLTYDQHVAIRSLNYDSAVKIGMKFKTRWWQKEGLVYPDQPDGPKFPNIKNGGQGLTDRLIGICVYPSYGLLDDVEKPAVLISSYTLAQDARRLGALIHGKDTKVEARLVDLVLYDLAKLHKMPFDFLKDQMVDHYAHDWYRDENAMGAFALFGPGQFSSTYPALLRPAGKGNLNFVGEALSSQHGWVAGALNSAWRGVDNIFNRMGDKERRKQLRAEWGGVEDLSEATLNLSVLIGTRGPEVAE